MSYTLDLQNISINKYKEILRNQDLLPSRKILHEDMDAKFNVLMDAGIENLDQLRKVLSTAPKMAAFSESTRMSKDYLAILKREVGSLEPKSVLLKEFPGIEPGVLGRAEKAGLKSSRDYYEFCESVTDMQQAAETLGIAEEAAEELFCLCDLVRINGVGAVAAKIFFEAGFKSVSEMAGTGAGEMLRRVSEVNKVKQYYRTKLGEKDMLFCIHYAAIIKTYENIKRNGSLYR